jgi:hypothetical protein
MLGDGEEKGRDLLEPSPPPRHFASCRLPGKDCARPMPAGDYQATPHLAEPRGDGRTYPYTT